MTSKRARLELGEVLVTFRIFEILRSFSASEYTLRSVLKPVSRIRRRDICGQSPESTAITPGAVVE
jgi:hypothetical protein